MGELDIFLQNYLSHIFGKHTIADTLKNELISGGAYHSYDGFFFLGGYCLKFVDLLPGGQILPYAFCMQDSFWLPFVTFSVPSFILVIVFFLLINLEIRTSLNLTNMKEIILLFCPVNKLCPNINPLHEKQRDGMFTSMKLLCPFT